MNPLTGNRDADLIILSNLDDRSLFNFCLTNSSANQLCKVESFWMNRFRKKFGNIAAKYKPEERSWRQHYLKVVADLDEYSEDPWSFFDNLVDAVYLEDVDLDTLFPEEDDETLHNAYWMLDLGKEVVLEFPIGYTEGEVVRKTYKTSKITPHDIIEQAYNFYHEPISIEEWRERRQDIFGQDFSEEDVIRGDVKKLDFFESKNLLGFYITYQDGIPYVYAEMS